MPDNSLIKPVETQHLKYEMLNDISTELLLATGTTGTVRKELVAVVSFGEKGNGALASVNFSVRVDGQQVHQTAYQQSACKHYNTLPSPTPE